MELNQQEINSSPWPYPPLKSEACIAGTKWPVRLFCLHREVNIINTLFSCPISHETLQPQSTVL